MTDDADATLERLDAIAASLADVAATVRQQREDLRIALEVLVEVAAKVDRIDEDAAPAPQANGVEVGALMGATQAAWLRLEQRLESEFSDIQRQLRSLTGPTEPTTRALAPPPRPPVGGDPLRRAASSVRDAMRGVRRPRR